MDSDSFIKAQAALLAWRDGHRNGVNGMLGVLFVVRRQTKLCGDNWMQIIRNRTDCEHEWPDVRDPEFQTLLQLVDSVYDGTKTDKLTNEATSYAETGTPDNICIIRQPQVYTAFHVESLCRVAQIGTLEFYRTD